MPPAIPAFSPSPHTGAQASSAANRYSCRLLFLAMAFAILYWVLVTVPIVYAFGNLSFWIVLLSPIWIPAVFGKNFPPSAWLRMLLVVPAVA